MKKEKQEKKVQEPVKLNIPESEIWTYRIEGLQEPHIETGREHSFGKVPHKVFAGLAGEGEPGCRGLRFDFTDDDYERAKGAEKRHVARAILEGAAHLLRDNLAELESCGLYAESVTAIGGITNSKIATGIVERVIERPLNVVNGMSAGAVGSCLLAGIGLGVYKNEHDAFDTMIRRQNEA